MNLPSFPFHRRLSNWRGFTMVELLGVMAIASLLALAVLPVTLSELDKVAREQEEANLKRLAQGLEKYVVRNQVIPDHTTWAAAVSSTLGDAPDRVLTNSRGQARVLLIDPTFAVGPTGTTPPPFTQSASGSSQVVNPRYLIISSLGVKLPSTLTSGFAASASAFNELWNLPDAAVPATWSWAGTGADLRIQRLNLVPVFHQVTLNNMTTLAGKYSVNDSPPAVLPATSFTAYFLAGSALGLHGVDGSLQSKEVVTHAFSFSFEDSLWRGRLFAGLIPAAATVTGADLESAATTFLSAASNATGTATTTQVMTAMQTYLTAYNAWAAAGFPASGSIKTTVDSAQTALETVTNGLIN